jgi:selenocysteine lyase/cysteine desulfurase
MSPMTATDPASVHGSHLVRLVGEEVQVPLVTGESRRYVNLDYAASAPALRAGHDAVEGLVGWYSSVHRGAGFKSRVATTAYEGARESIRRFVNARVDVAVIITRNTTDSINLLAGTLPSGTHVVCFAGEHHANLLPWKRIGVRYLPVPQSPAQMLETLEATLRELPTCGDPHLVAVTGASSVTGEIWPIADIARIAHDNGARLRVDAAQLAPHAPIDMQRDGIDFLALSGHKLYAPYGAGALIGERDWLSTGDPFLRGGGAVKLVTVDETLWADLPDRQEAGSPNVVGAVALGVACETLASAGMDRVADEERALLAYARERLGDVPGFRHYRVWPSDHPRVGLLTFSLGSLPYDLLAAVLSAEHGIGIRHGCFCAHPLMMRLLKVGDAEAHRLVEETRAGHHERLPGAARMSLGLGSSRADVDALADALRAIAADGPRWTYAVNPNTDEYEPDPDPRPLPKLRMRLVDHPHGHGESA